MPSKPTSDHITFDAPCRYCEYNLRTLPMQGTCPECGQEVMDTLHHNLQFASFAWLEEVASGAKVLAWSPIFTVALLILGFMLVVVFDSLGFLVLMLVVGIGGTGFAASGTLRLTATEPNEKPHARSRVQGLARAAPLIFGILLSGILCFPWGVAALGGTGYAGILLMIGYMWPALLASHAGRLLNRQSARGAGILPGIVFWVGTASAILTSLATAFFLVVWFSTALGTTKNISYSIMSFVPCLLLPLFLILLVLHTILMFQFSGALRQALAACKVWQENNDTAADDAGDADPQPVG